jgi:acyl-CoA reductase-like NAD-dependent aldehyde dehydrogenase
MAISPSTVLAMQRQWFATGKTRPISFRIEQLTKLKSLVLTHQPEIVAALKHDLNKTEMESVATEIFLVIKEIDFIVCHLKEWAKPHRVTSPFPFCWPGKSTIYTEPYGSVLIIAPWNYPFMLVMSPLIGAMCAGNCAIIKPAEMAVHMEAVITRLINNHFPAEYLFAVQGGAPETKQLLQEKFDYIFFTGGTRAGKMVMQAAADHLTPVTLELGGKSPCIVDETANVEYAARRIAWAKWLNAGQVCLAPDYVLVHHACKNAFIDKLQQAIAIFYGDDPAQSNSYCRIINQTHFARINQLMKAGRILFGGETNAADLYIAPTLLDQVSWDDDIMQEEIFGPILPILTYHHIDEVIATLQTRPEPLALYLFANSKPLEQSIIARLPFGGGCINDCILQVANYHFPFGGRGASGMGAYHGKYSFDTFSHRKPIYKKSPAIDFNLTYPPYTESKLKWLKRLLRLG